MSKTKILTAKEIWDKDEFKIKTLKQLNYEILIIWENEISNEETLQKCLKFLQNGN
jgi:G:T-mismatch repair DNA endonuclease (very short patch repair protein)